MSGPSRQAEWLLWLSMMNLSEVISFFLQTQQWNVITWRSTSNTMGEESTSTGSAGLRVCVCVFFKTNSGFVTEYGTMGHDWAYREAVGSGGGGIWYQAAVGYFLFLLI